MAVKQVRAKRHLLNDRAGSGAAQRPGKKARSRGHSLDGRGELTQEPVMIQQQAQRVRLGYIGQDPKRLFVASCP